jgi:hypothetical protein
MGKKRRVKSEKGEVKREEGEERGTGTGIFLPRMLVDISCPTSFRRIR